MIGAGLLAKNAVERGPAGQAVGEDVARARLEGRHRVPTSDAGLIADLEALGFHVVGYGCTTCIGNSGPLPPEISDVVNAEDLAVVSVLSAATATSRGASTPTCALNYLASPPLVVAYALAGTMDIDLSTSRSARTRRQATSSSRTSGRRRARSPSAVEHAVQSRACSTKSYGEVFEGDERWRALDVPEGDRFAWDRRVDLRAPAAVLRRHASPSRAPLERHRGRARARACSATRSRPTTSRRPARSQGLAGGEVPRRARRRARGLQLLRRAARQPRGDDARHVREHPPEEPDRSPGVEGGVTRTCRRASRCRSTTPR